MLSYLVLLDVASVLMLMTHECPASESAQMITKKEFKQLVFPASMHAIGHVAANLSFAAVAISLTHTVRRRARFRGNVTV